MKQAFLIALLFLSFSFNSHSQDALTFRVKYNPETTYHQIITQTSETDMTYSGSDDFLKILKDKGIQNPTVKNTSSVIELDLKTGKLKANKQFPLTMEFLKSMSSDGTKVIPDGTIIYGHATADNMPQLDSIVSDELDSEFKKSMLQTIQNTLSQVTFPVKTLKIGESFSVETPLSIPISGNTIEMIVVTNYKLISIANNLGNFETIQNYTLKSTISDTPITARGSGTGNLIYDINNNFLLRFHTDTQLDMSMNVNDITIAVKSKSGYTVEVKISK